MSNELWRIVLAVVIGAHGLGHVLFLVSCLGLANWGQSTRSWLLTSLAGDRVTCAIGNMLWVAAIAGFMAAAVGILSQQEWWRVVAIGSAGISLLGLALFLDRQPTPPTLSAAIVDLAILAALLWLQWPPPALIGS
jgi:hypothetical protein